MRLICHKVSDEFPDIRPAATRRGWMDETAQRSAYNCLPLSIANSCGWEILNPVPFSAVWDGGQGTEAITVESEDEKAIATSHFGSGVLTFEVQALFETETRMQLWAGGSPNYLKDGIQALTGIIETDWSPYTFTMNWKFTRPFKRIEFEKGEPFCFIMPINLDLVESIKPEFRDLESDPEKNEAYQLWREDRNEYVSKLREDRIEEIEGGMDKAYLRGQNPDGSEAKSEHRTKIKVRKFQR